MPRLSREQVECIKALLRMGKSYREIAREVGVHYNTVMRYARQLRDEGVDVNELGNSVIEDAKFVMNVAMQRLDPKHPVRSKWIEDVAWWTHLMLDFSKLMLPDAMRLLGEGEIDIRNPEATARNMVVKLRELRRIAEQRAEKLLEYESKIRELEGEVKLLSEENRRLRELMEEYDEVLGRLRSFIEDLKSRISSTLIFIVKYVPQALSPSERATYMHVLTPKIRELWGVEVG